MKYLILLFCWLVSTLSVAEAPEPIAPKTKIIRSLEWYAEQAKLWEKETEKLSSSAEAWFNFYNAARYAQQSRETLNQISQQMIKAVPNTYEALVVQAMNEGYTENAFKILTRAFALNPNQPAAYGPLMLFQEYYLHPEDRREVSRKLLASGQVSQALLSYSYNVLMSIEDHAILFTEGDNTTLPLFILQDVMGVRKDVAILNLDLLSEDSYRMLKLKASSLAFSNSDQANTPLDQKKLLCALLPQQNPEREFYFALTIGRENISSIKDQLYVVGLASQLSKARPDNISTIKNNLEKRFLLDYLTVDFNGENEFAAGRVLSTNYLVPMLLLHEHYVSAGDVERAKGLEAIVIKLASEGGKELLVKNILKKYPEDRIPFVPFPIDKKGLEESMRMVGGKIYAQSHEVTNKEFNIFLDYLVQNKFDDLYQKYKFDLSAYEEPALSFMKNYTTARIPVKKDKFFTNYPAVNISHESALAYCEWLTEQYNNSNERKYKKVIFRLPGIDEWQIAAASVKNPKSWKLAENSAEVKVYPPGKMAGKDFTMKTIQLSDPEVLYPWFRFYEYRNKAANSFGCYLGNFKIPDNVKPCQAKKMTTADGWMAMAPVETYFPNDIGLYDVVGNVAEMIDEKGKACGGSWNHSPEESTIRSIIEYKGPDSATGFRIFMEVVEQ